MERAISEIKIGERHRKHLGDLESLMKSIEEIGLLHPIVALPDGTLLAGQRRLEACRALGWEKIPVTTTDTLAGAAEHLIVERDENTCRVDMLPSEKATLGIALETIERPAAEARERAGTKLASGNLPEGTKSSGDTRDLVGAAVGLSGKTYEKAKKVTEAAKDPDLDPETRAAARNALAEMDRTGKIGGAFREFAKVTSKPENDDEAPSFTERQKSQAKTYKEQAWVNLRQLEALVEGMTVSAEKLEAAMTPEDYKRMADQMENSLRSLKALRKLFLERAEMISATPAS